MSKSKNNLSFTVVANKFLILALFIITIFPAFSQDSDKQPQFTVKVGAGVLASNGTDYYDLKKSTYYQPAIHAGLKYKQMIYVGFYGSKYMIFKKDYAYGLDRHIIAGEVGIPLRKFLIGFTIGQDNYRAPHKGYQTAVYEFKSAFLGGFVDYRVWNYLSIPVRMAYSADSNYAGFGGYWHFSIGLSGNITF